MVNFREVNDDDILKELYDCMEETYLCYVDGSQLVIECLEK